MSETPITDMFKAFMHGVDGDKYWVPVDCAKGLEKMARKARVERDKYRRAVELIAEDCEAWLNSESDEPSADFIKLVAKYAREATQ
jgi:hypothetical protein